MAIHAHFADAGMRIARYARRRNLPLIVTLHGADVLRRRKELIIAGLFYGYLRREMLRSTTLFLAVSDFIKQAALRAGYPGNRFAARRLASRCRRILPEQRSTRDGLCLISSSSDGSSKRRD